MCITVSAQKKDSVVRHLDENLKFTTRNKAVYAALSVYREGRYKLFAVYPDTTMLLEMSFSDRNLTVKDGPFTLFHMKRQRAQQGYFTNNVPDGNWQNWHESGQIKDSGTFINNHFAGTWKHWYQNGQLRRQSDYDTNVNPADPGIISQPNAGILDNIRPGGKLHGPSQSWYPNGNRESAGNHRNDSLDGVWMWFREDGTLSSKETYAGGKVVALECFDEKGNFSGSTCSILKAPVLIHPFLSAAEYVVDQLHSIRKNRISNEGTAEVTFTVAKDGSIKNLLIVSSPDEHLSKHIVDIFAKMPGWSPAVSHNRPIDFPMTLRIPYFHD